MTGKNYVYAVTFRLLSFKKIRYYFKELNQYFIAHLIYVNINLGLL